MDTEIKPADAGEELRLTENDFTLYRKEFQRNEEYNDRRLVVRRRLDAIGKKLCKSLTTKSLSLTSRASLHHPYTFNGYCVRSQMVYLSRAEKERKALKRILGVELGKDLDQNYVHVLMVLEIDEQGVEVAIRVHKSAWWDGENLKRRLNSLEQREVFAGLLQQLHGYSLRIDDFQRLHACETITAKEIQETLGYYKPGDHWLHILQRFDRDDPFVTEPDFMERVEAEFSALLPTFTQINWSNKNNYLFSE